MSSLEKQTNCSIIHRGNANVLVSLDSSIQLYRICRRYRSLRENNEYSAKNLEYIRETLWPILQEHLIPAKLCLIESFRVRRILEFLDIKSDEERVLAFELPNLIPSSCKTTELDHFSKVHVNGDVQVIWEFKPKWLYQSTAYCRNCTHNRLRNRRISYCFGMLLKDSGTLKRIFQGAETILPQQFLSDIKDVLEKPDNVLQQLYCAQRAMALQAPLLSSVTSQDAVTSSLQTLMTLRDVSCFVFWTRPVSGGGSQIEAKLIDVDLKPSEKWSHWVGEFDKVNNYHDKVYH